MTSMSQKIARVMLMLYGAGAVFGTFYLLGDGAYLFWGICIGLLGFGWALTYAQ